MRRDFSHEKGRVDPGINPRLDFEVLEALSRRRQAQKTSEARHGLGATGEKAGKGQCIEVKQCRDNCATARGLDEVEMQQKGIGEDKGIWLPWDDPLYHLTGSHLPRTITRPEVTLFRDMRTSKKKPKIVGKKRGLKRTQERSLT